MAIFMVGSFHFESSCLHLLSRNGYSNDRRSNYEFIRYCSGHVPPPEFQKSLDRLCTAWSPTQLDAILYQEVQKWPRYEPYLSHAYKFNTILIFPIVSNNEINIQSIDFFNLG